MTREEIDDGLYEWALRQNHRTRGGKWDHVDMMNFALEMVRRHNEECAEIADKYWHPTLGAAEPKTDTALYEWSPPAVVVHVAKAIREAKP